MKKDLHINMNSLSDGSMNGDLVLPDINKKKILQNSRSDPLLRVEKGSVIQTTRSKDVGEEIEPSNLNF